MADLNMLFPYFSEKEETEAPYPEEICPSPEEMEVKMTPGLCAPEDREIPEKENSRRAKASSPEEMAPSPEEMEVIATLGPYAAEDREIPEKENSGEIPAVSEDNRESPEFVAENNILVSLLGGWMEHLRFYVLSNSISAGYLHLKLKPRAARSVC